MIKQLYFDSGICPKCHKKDVMIEITNLGTTMRECTSCDYVFEFKRKELKDE